jgi:multiple antibiotic resistance protein
LTLPGDPLGLAANFGLGGFVSLISVINPPSTMPTYIALSKDMEPKAKLNLAARACLYSGCILVVSLFAGGFVLEFFGISYGALRIAGGLVVVLLGYGLMYDKGDAHRATQSGASAQNPAFFPLAMPSITGPGTIAVVVGISTEIRGLGAWREEIVAYAVTVAAMALVCIVEWLFLRSAKALDARLGPGGIDAMTRLSGFILICVGVQFIASGVLALVHGA